MTFLTSTQDTYVITLPRARWGRIGVLAACVLFWTGVAVSCAHAAEPRCEPQKAVLQFRCDFPRVVDGDTLACPSGERVRLFGVDAVERGQPGYKEAGQALSSITREPLECRMLYRDKYRRAVAMCFNSRGDVGAQLIALGSVKDYPKYSRGYYGPACWGGWR